MIRFLIVGYGNPLRSDDAVGWHIAQELSRELSCELPRDDVQVIATQQLTPEIAEVASRTEQVLFIDAARDGAPGSVKCEPILPASSTSRHSHELSPAAILKLAKDLYGRYPTAQLLTIVGESFETGETMSPSVLAAVPTAMAQVRRLVDGDEVRRSK